ncbi:hypothetical protein [Arsenicicoccus dermatophilus]|uniref:hypothetical protein n=1 Tax=Arsenicicoccus dermatophilus TaxID=1076331 RepID=UPI001F4CAF57|nr:hypothetical protein [Arsenicicoccus dermatophilus]MCH8614435.1 hypothetical protein [Arsenicicoccus dermatophilus]
MSTTTRQGDPLDGAEAAAWAESPERDLTHTTILHGQAAQDFTTALLADVLADDPSTAAEFEAAREAGRGGRPSLSPTTPGPSPTWSLRVPADLDTAMRQRAADEGTTLPALLRRIADDYLAHAS